MTKVCKTCLVEKPDECFRKNHRECKECTRTRQRKWQQEHRAQVREFNRESYKRNKTKRISKTSEYRKRMAALYPEKVAERRRSYLIRTRFARSLERSRQLSRNRGYAECTADVEEIETAFTGKCHVCGVHESECAKRLAMDHDHETGIFRGWLCQRCNHSAGLLRDSPTIALSLAEYLERFTNQPTRQPQQ